MRTYKNLGTTMYSIQEMRKQIIHLFCSTSLDGKSNVHCAVNNLGSAWQRSFQKIQGLDARGWKYNWYSEISTLNKMIFLYQKLKWCLLWVLSDFLKNRFWNLEDFEILINNSKVCVCFEFYSMVRVNFMSNQCVRANDVVLLHCCWVRL